MQKLFTWGLVIIILRRNERKTSIFVGFYFERDLILDLFPYSNSMSVYSGFNSFCTFQKDLMRVNFHVLTLQWSWDPYGRTTVPIWDIIKLLLAHKEQYGIHLTSK